MITVDQFTLELDRLITLGIDALKSKGVNISEDATIEDIIKSIGDINLKELVFVGSIDFVSEVTSHYFDHSITEEVDIGEVIDDVELDVVATRYYDVELTLERIDITPISVGMSSKITIERGE
jgi:hypothetical protein